MLTDGEGTCLLFVALILGALTMGLILEACK